MEASYLASGTRLPLRQPVKRQLSELASGELPPVKKHLPLCGADYEDARDVNRRYCERVKAQSAPPSLNSCSFPAFCSRKAVEEMVACSQRTGLPADKVSGAKYAVIARQLEVTFDAVLKENRLEAEENAAQRAAFRKLLCGADVSSFVVGLLSEGDGNKITIEKMKVFAREFGLEVRDLLLLLGSLEDLFLYCSPEELRLAFAYMCLLQHHPMRKEVNASGESNKSDQIEDDDSKNLMFSRLLGIACADFLQVVRSAEHPERVINPAWMLSSGYVVSLQQRDNLYDKVCPSEDSMLFILVPFNRMWWQSVSGALDETRWVSTLSSEQLVRFLGHTVLPTQLKCLLFDARAGSALPVCCNLPETPCQPLRPERFLFGEEFEYEIPLKEERDFDTVRLEAMQSWKGYVTSVCPEATFIETQFKGVACDNKEFEGFDTEDTVTAMIGGWQVKVFPEPSAENGRPVIEFNASPYAISRQFRVGSSSLSAYDLLKKFVIEPARQMGWMECSGHKHVDIAGSIGNNAGLLFRLLVAIENNAWLSVITQQGRYAKRYFPYICQTERADVCKEYLTKALDTFNGCLKEGCVSKPGHAFSQTDALRIWWQVLNGEGLGRGPGNINCHSLSTSESVLKGQISDPESTIEFRFFHCARSDDEVRLINQLLVAWITHLS